MNAKGEFTQHIFGLKRVKCAYIDEHTHKYELACHYNQEEYDQFLNSLDFNYDAGYGSQELYGTIWYEDGTWSSRWEYDGSEGWEYNKCPTIPNELIRIDRMRDNKLNDLGI